MSCRSKFIVASATHKFLFRLDTFPSVVLCHVLPILINVLKDLDNTNKSTKTIFVNSNQDSVDAILWEVNFIVYEIILGCLTVSLIVHIIEIFFLLLNICEIFFMGLIHGKVVKQDPGQGLLKKLIGDTLAKVFLMRLVLFFNKL